MKFKSKLILLPQLLRAIHEVFGSFINFTFSKIWLSAHKTFAAFVFM